MKLGIVGCGNIAHFHVHAMRTAGFEVVSVAGSFNSVRAPEFAKKHAIDKFYNDPLELLENSSEWDALLLAPSVDVTAEYIKRIAPLGKPILTEKPVALDHEALTPLLDFENVLVAYNRRFYSSVEYAKDFISKHSNIVIKVSIPEGRKDPEHNAEFPGKLPFLSYYNSVHLIDIVTFISGEIEWTSTQALRDKEKFLALSALGKTKGGAIVQLDSCYNSPENFAINIIADNQRLELRPIEIVRHYRGMRVNEPTDLTPIRTYTPELINQIIVTEDEGIKPGFLGQAQDFMTFCKGKGNPQSATIKDAYIALKTIHLLAKNND